ADQTSDVPVEIGRRAVAEDRAAQAQIDLPRESERAYRLDALRPDRIGGAGAAVYVAEAEDRPAHPLAPLLELDEGEPGGAAVGEHERPTLGAGGRVRPELVIETGAAAADVAERGVGGAERDEVLGAAEDPEREPAGQPVGGVAVEAVLVAVEGERA